MEILWQVIVRYAEKLRILNHLEIRHGKNPIVLIADPVSGTDYPGCFSRRKQIFLSKRKKRYFMSRLNRVLRLGSKRHLEKII